MAIYTRIDEASGQPVAYTTINGQEYRVIRPGDPGWNPTGAPEGATGQANIPGGGKYGQAQAWFNDDGEIIRQDDWLTDPNEGDPLGPLVMAALAAGGGALAFSGAGLGTAETIGGTAADLGTGGLSDLATSTIPEVTTGTEGDWYNTLNPNTTSSITTPPPTGSEGDWYLDSSGNPIPSNSNIMPDGTIVPPGTLGSTPLVPSPGTYDPLNPAPPISGTNPIGDSIVTPPSTGTTIPPVTTGGGSTDWGGLLSSIAGMYGANEQTKAYERIADRAWDAGAPSRTRYESSMTPGFDALDIPGYKSATDTATDSYLKKLSRFGNPSNVGGAMGDTMSYVLGTTGLPAIHDYQQLNSTSGGLSTLANTSQQNAMDAITSQGNVYGQLGSGLNSLFGNKDTSSVSTLSDLAKMFPNLKFT